jgi:hypothetical protein
MSSGGLEVNETLSYECACSSVTWTYSADPMVQVLLEAAREEQKLGQLLLQTGRPAFMRVRFRSQKQ